MSSFISLFKEMYFKDTKNVDEITNESLHNKLISLLKKNSNDQIDNNDLLTVELYDNNIKLIAHGLMSQSKNDKEEASKKVLLKKLINGKLININELANKYKNCIAEEIIIFRKSIVSSIVKKPNINSINIGEEDYFNEDSFFNYLSQEKQLVANFLSKYKIKKRFKFNSKLFDDILENYQSFNLECLSNLYNYVDSFDNFYQIYMNFATIIKSINKINNILKNMKNDGIDSNYVDNVYHGLEEGSFNISSLFNKLNKKMEKLSQEVKINSKEIEKLKSDNEKLKSANNNLDNRVKFLEESLENIREDLECPISTEIIKNPIITPDGFTYEKQELKNWIKIHGNEPITHTPLSENQLTYNFAFKKVLDKYNKIMNNNNIK